MAAIEKICPDARSMLLIPENHTRNTFYLQNVARLQTILRQAGLNVRIGTLTPEITAPTAIELPTAATDARAARAPRQPPRARRISIPCAILLNNDLSAGMPAILENLEQSVLPPLHAGWAVRRKSNHFGPTTTSRKNSRNCSDRSVADQPVLRAVRRDQFPGTHGRGMPRGLRRRAPRRDPRQVRANTASGRSRS